MGDNAALVGRVPTTRVPVHTRAASELAPSAPIQFRHTHTALASGIIGAAVALRVALALRGWPDVDSDLAIVGLMARHILTHGASPVFYYGQHYNGPLDAYFAAVFFALLGPTNLALNLSAVPLLVLFLGGTYALGRMAYGPVPALLALVYLAFGPAFALLLGSHYPVFGVVDGLGVLLLLLVYLRVRTTVAPVVGPAAAARLLAHYAAIGLVAGLGIWSAQLMLPFVLVAFVTLVLTRREVFRAPGLALLAGMITGCWPLLAYNLQHGWITFVEVEHAGSLSSGVSRSVPVALLLVLQFAMVLSAGLPALFGSPHVCLPASDSPGSYPPALASLGPGLNLACSGLNLTFSLAVIVCYIIAARAIVGALLLRIRASRSRRRAPLDVSGVSMNAGGPGAPKTTADRARLWLRGMLIMVAALTVALDLTSTTAAFLPFATARYLLPMYVSVPVVFGVLWGSAASGAKLIVPAFVLARESRSARLGIGRIKRISHTINIAIGGSAAPMFKCALASGALVMLLACAGYGVVRSADYAARSNQFGLPTSPDDQQLLASLRTHDVTTFFASYWICYRLVFESGERTVCADHEAGNALITPAYNRYLPYVLVLRRTVHPAYIFLAGSAEDTGFARDAAANGWPHVGYSRCSVAGYAVYYFPTATG